MGQEDYDYFPVFYTLSERDQNKVLSIVNYTATQGPGTNREKWNPLGDGLFEMKPGQYRIPFFYHSFFRRIIVVTHLFKKQKQKTSSDDLERAYDRMRLGNAILSLEE